ncbi:histidine phosphatase family protein [Nanoarchaeota archaeon]
MQKILLSRHSQTLSNAIDDMLDLHGPENMHKVGRTLEAYRKREKVKSFADLERHLQEYGKSLRDLSAYTFDFYRPEQIVHAKNLTGRGFNQAQTLGMYLEQQNLKSLVAITSGLERTHETLHTAHQSGNLPIVKHIKDPDLNETISAELFDHVNRITLEPYQRKWIEARPSAADVGQTAYISLLYTALARPDHDIFAVLHGALNSAFLNLIDHSDKHLRDYHMDNCGLITIELEDTQMRIADEKSYTDILGEVYSR